MESTTPVRFRFALAVALGVGLAAAPAQAEEFPPRLVNWAPLPGDPVFQGAGDGAWDKKIRERGCILVEGGEFRLWYTGYNDDRSKSRFLGRAVSPDGLHWTRDPANPVFAGSWTEDVFVLKRDGSYLMVAEGENDQAHQLRSADGRAWTELGKLDVRLANGSPIPPGPYGTPTLWFDDGVYSLFYERGDQGVWLARSRDMRVWTNVKDAPVLALGPDAYDRAAVALNQVVKRDGVYYAFYHANARRPWADWTSCIARSRDLVHWEKHPGNPIVENNASSPFLVALPDGGDRLYTMHPDVRAYAPSADRVRVKPASGGAPTNAGGPTLARSVTREPARPGRLGAPRSAAYQRR
jgi:hypothetical protein